MLLKFSKSNHKHNLNPITFQERAHEKMSGNKGRKTYQGIIVMTMIIYNVVFTEYSLCARNIAKSFTCIVSINP